jgi:hypothetical protein
VRGLKHDNLYIGIFVCVCYFTSWTGKEIGPSAGEARKFPALRNDFPVFDMGICAGHTPENCAFYVEISAFAHERLLEITRHGGRYGGLSDDCGTGGDGKLSGQTIRRYVLNKTIPYHKIQKAVRFRLSEIETWIDGGGISVKTVKTGGTAGDLFGEAERGAIAGEGPPESAELQEQEEKPHE